jgi:hypothetical protein
LANSDLGSPEDAILDRVTRLLAIDDASGLLTRYRCLVESLVTIGVELLARRIERLDVILEEGRDKAALGKLNTVVELDQSLLWCLGVLNGGGLGRGVSKGTLRDGLEGKG